MQGKVEICGVNTSTLKVLKSDEIRPLLEKAQAGDKAARDELIRGNLRLVLSVIQKFIGRGDNVDDLFQVGCIGLIKAIDNFDYKNHDVRFSTYGVPRRGVWGKSPGKDVDMTRKQAIRTVLAHLDSLPETSDALCKAKIKLQEMLNGIPGKIWDDTTIREAIDRFIRENGRPPTVKELDSVEYLPPHPSIYQFYKVTAGKWLDENYPNPEKRPWRYRYADYTEAKYLQTFAENYNRTLPRSGLEYNRTRDKKTPSWEYIAKQLSVTGFAQLRELCRDELSPLPLLSKPRSGEQAFEIVSSISILE